MEKPQFPKESHNGYHATILTIAISVISQLPNTAMAQEKTHNYNTFLPPEFSQPFDAMIKASTVLKNPEATNSDIYDAIMELLVAEQISDSEEIKKLLNKLEAKVEKST